MQGADWLAVRSILGNLRGCVLLDGKVHDSWPIRCGVPQGGALSQELFESPEAELVNKLMEAGCGVEVTDGEGHLLVTPCLFIVDDVVLLATNPAMLQVALDVAARWAQQVRMRWNVGVAKSAIMIFGAGRVDTASLTFQWRLGARTIPIVSQYKYAGVVTACRGSGRGHIQHMRMKALSKSGSLVA